MKQADDSGSSGLSELSRNPLYLTTVMVNSSLLKAVHVAESFQGYCIKEYPEQESNLEDPYASFDGTLTTIYESNVASSKTPRDVKNVGKAKIPVVPAGSPSFEG